MDTGEQAADALLALTDPARAEQLGASAATRVRKLMSVGVPWREIEKRYETLRSVALTDRSVMRVLHWYPNFLGGGAVANVVSGLALGQRRAGAEVRIAAADEGGNPVYGRESAEVDALVLPWKPRWRVGRGNLVLRGIPSQLRREVKAFAPDVVHAHGEFNPDNFWALRIGGRAPLVVLSPQGAFDPGVFRKSNERSKRLYVALARRLVYDRLGSFHALSPREEDQARAVAPNAPTYVLPQGGGPAASSDLTEQTSDPRRRSSSLSEGWTSSQRDSTSFSPPLRTRFATALTRST